VFDFFAFIAVNGYVVTFTGPIFVLFFSASLCVLLSTVLCTQVHRHNVRIWANERPRDFVAHERDSPEVNVWCTLTKDRVIGPYFFAERNVTSHNYLDMLELFAVPQIDDDNVIFQQDGAPGHYANIVMEFLDEIFPRRWIGKCGWKQWPPRSPDLTPLVFYFWGCVKQIVYSVRIHNIQHLKQRIREAAASVTLGRVWQNGIPLRCLQSHQ
jgi:hypothetical protein